MKRIIIFLITIAITPNLKAQDVPIDLSQGSNVSQTINPMTISSITLLNCILDRSTRYSVEIEKMRTSPPDLPTAGLFAASDPTECDNLVNATKKLKTTAAEEDIPTAIKDVQAEIAKANAATCKSTISDALIAIGATKKTIQLSAPITINKGEMLKINVKRGDKTICSYELRTETTNHWKLYFGFSYMPDIISKFDNFYAKEDTGGTYLISKMNNKKKNTFSNISPTVMFTYRFYKKEDAPVKFGLTFGFQYNLETLGAMAGPSIIIGDNASITSGVVFAQKYQLKGQYAEGQRISDVQDFDGLHEKVWTFDFFISIGFHISELFKKSDEKKATVKNPAAAP